MHPHRSSELQKDRRLPAGLQVGDVRWVGGGPAAQGEEGEIKRPPGRGKRLQSGAPRFVPSMPVVTSAPHCLLLSLLNWLFLWADAGRREMKGFHRSCLLTCLSGGSMGWGGVGEGGPESGPGVWG